jgi:hypothetical protein
VFFPSWNIALCSFFFISKNKSLFFIFLQYCVQCSFQVLSDIIPKETLIWRLKLLQSAAAYANSRLHAVRAESLVLAGSVNEVPLYIYCSHILCYLNGP